MIMFSILNEYSSKVSNYIFGKSIRNAELTSGFGKPDGESNKDKFRNTVVISNHYNPRYVNMIIFIYLLIYSEKYFQRSVD